MVREDLLGDPSRYPGSGPLQGGIRAISAVGRNLSCMVVLVKSFKKNCFPNQNHRVT